MNPLGLKLWSVNTDVYREEAMRLYDKGVFQYLEIYFVPNTLDTASLWKETKIPCIVHAPHSVHGVNLADRDYYNDNMRIYADVKRFTDQLNAPLIIQHSGIFGELEEAIRQMNAINDKRLIVENKPYLPIDDRDIYLVGSTPAEIKQICLGTGHSFCLDIGHMISSANAHNESWRDYYKDFQMLKPTMYHLSDMDITSSKDQHLHFGKGNLPLQEILVGMNPDVCISIETVKSFRNHLNDFKLDCNVLCNEIVKRG